MFSEEENEKSYGFSLDEITNFDERTKPETHYNGVGYNQELATAIKSILPVKTTNVFYRRRMELALKKKAKTQSKLAIKQSKLVIAQSKLADMQSELEITQSKSTITQFNPTIRQLNSAIAESKSEITQSK